jgi:DNA-binding CsgD family transcriptional regulator
MTDSAPQPALSETELAILKLVATGATNREIAHQRGISEATVKKHLTNINGKLGTGNRTEAVRRALEQGLVSVDTPEDTSAVAERDAMRSRDLETTRKLAAELERSRRKSRNLLRATVVASVLLIALAAAAVADLPPFDSEPPIAVQTQFSNLDIAWNPGGRLPGARDGAALAFADALYIIGGETESGVVSDTLRRSAGGLRGLTPDWPMKAAKPTAVKDIRAVVVAGEIVVPGGCDGAGNAVAPVEIYDTALDAWRSGPPLPEPVCDYALAEVNGRIFIFGGRSGASAANATEKVWSLLFGRDNTWQAEPRLDRPRSGMAAAVVDGRIHLIGGRDDQDEMRDNHWIFDPALESRWMEGAGDERPLPSGRAGHVAVGVSVLQRIYLVGGNQDRGEPDTLVLDLSGDEGWRPFAEIRTQTPQMGAAAIVKGEGREIWLAGGLDIDGERLNNTYILIQTPLFDRLLKP